MRLSRLGLVALALVPCIAVRAHAQEERLFQDSWFWGVHAGGTSIGTGVGSSSMATTVGAEWLITRTNGGLYLAYDQANFTRTGSVFDAAATSAFRPVQIHDMRTGSIAALAFPFHSSSLRPYAGAGFAISVLGSATTEPDSSGSTPSATVNQRAEDARSRSTVFGMAGVQWQRERLALYGQVVAMPSNSEFLVTRNVTSFTAGVRYNFGSSIER